MNDLDPQDHPQHCDLSGSNEPPAERRLAEIGQPVARGPGRFASREEIADLSTLDDEALATEAKREALRDRRQERQVRADQAMQRRSEGVLAIGKQVALVGLLIFTAAGSMAVTISGLVDQNADIIEAGLLALCAISGGTIYQLGLKADPPDSRARHEGGER